ncbi:apolipoprotein acyltransferase [Primorskyibacter sp. S187A]|uniref:apolipoprotein acyltransferase n=1 Tax=Primorskyibacter sp. S187A TaxID=3415130 RepID=UPI003C7CEAD5
MLVIGGLILGAGIGGYTAKKRGGTRADILQYAAGYGLAFCLLGTIATLVVHRVLV